MKTRPFIKPWSFSSALSHKGYKCDAECRHARVQECEAATRNITAIFNIIIENEKVLAMLNKNNRLLAGTVK